MNSLVDVEKTKQDIRDAFDIAGGEAPAAWRRAKHEAILLIEALVAERDELRKSVLRQEQRIIELTTENANAG